MSYTKGPWEVKFKRDQGATIMANDGHGKIASVVVRYSKTDNLAENAANARLISAAPDLLEALKIIANAERKDGRYDKYDAAGLVKIAQKAIGKAEPGK